MAEEQPESFLRRRLRTVFSRLFDSAILLFLAGLVYYMISSYTSIQKDLEYIKKELAELQEQQRELDVRSARLPSLEKWAACQELQEATHKDIEFLWSTMECIERLTPPKQMPPK